MRLHDITFEGQSFPANRLHLQPLSEGVYELTGDADRVGNWRLALRDAADGYYGLGERFNELNHTHQVIRNGSQDNGAAKGSATYKPIPFYLSTTVGGHHRRGRLRSERTVHPAICCCIRVHLCKRTSTPF